jgi:hypothetical protein
MWHHIKFCDGTQKSKKDSLIKIKEEWKQENGMYKCPYCQKEYIKTGLGTHIWRIHGEGINHNPNRTYKKGRYAWNKGLTKETDEHVKQFSDTLKNNYKNGTIIPVFKGKHHKKESIEKMSLKMSMNNKGGRCKWYEIEKPNGEKVKVQGTWELSFVKVLNILDENWIKPTIGNKEHVYEWIDKNDKKHFYTPDFYSPKLKKYFEVKGYWWGDDKEKMEYVLSQHKLNLEIIQKKELEIYLKLIQ